MVKDWVWGTNALNAFFLDCTFQQNLKCTHGLEPHVHIVAHLVVTVQCDISTTGQSDASFDAIMPHLFNQNLVPRPEY